MIETGPTLRRSIRTKLAVFVSVLVVFTVVLLAGGGYVFVRGLLYEGARERLTADARGRRDLLRAYISQQHERASLVASRTRFRQLLAGHLDGTIVTDTFRKDSRLILEDAKAGTQGFTAIWTTDPNGKVVTATDPAYLDQIYVNHPAYEQGRTERFMSVPLATERGYEAIVSAPAKDEQGRLLGVVMVALNVDAIKGMLAETGGEYETGEVLVGYVEGDQIRYFFSVNGESAAMQSPIDEVPAMMRAVRGESGFMRTRDYSGTSVLATYEPVGYRYWGLVTKVNEAEAYAPVARLRWMAIGIGLGVLLLALAATWAIARRFTRPILAMSRVATAVAAGNYSSRAQVRGDDELGALGAAFNHMAAALERHRDHLEVLVEQRTAELRGSQQMFRAVTETAPDAIVTADQSGHITFFNRGAQHLLGYSEAQVKGKPLALLMPARFREAHSNGIARFLKTGAAKVIGRTVELAALRKDDTEVPIELSLSAWTTPGGEAAFTGILRDITERKEEEQLLKKSSEDLRRSEMELREAKNAAEQANRIKSEFLANMSHEIRTPMNGVIGMLELLLGTGASPQQREYLGVARQSAEALLRLLNDILDFSKIEAGKLELEHIGFELRDVLGDTLQALAVRAAGKKLELAFDIPIDVPDQLIGDPGRLRQIVINLVGNAIKFTDVGEVVVKVELVSAAEEEATLHFHVKDTGPGISAEHQGNLFEAFSQADSSMSRKFGGTGLGLAISAQLVALMNGRIWVASELGRGSTFHFTGTFGRRSAQTRREPLSLHGLCVLVVDDNETNRRILATMLANWGMKPSVADSGAAALKRLEATEVAREPIAVILLDAMMPEMDGFELASRIRQRPDLAQLPVLLLSSGGGHGDAARCVSLGIPRRLIKPVKPSTLLDAIVDTLAHGDSARGMTEQAALDEFVTPLHILLAEDGVVNQKVATKLLERRGHSVLIANNGREAVDALERETFDVVLMDVQMPVMDGFEATAEIRRREAEGKAKTRIIAMTAHAMKGDRERCLDAGMDDYVSKPIRPDALYAAVERFQESPSVPPVAAAPATVADEVFNRGEALEQMGNDAKIARELVSIFNAECPALLAAVREAIPRADAPALAKAAHTLKGSVGVFGASPTWNAALRLEEVGRSGDLAGATAALQSLEKEIDRLLPALDQFARDMEETSNDNRHGG
ncbi:MAG: response regulator [Phycisphaeraceae bacterium]